MSGHAAGGHGHAWLVGVHVAAAAVWLGGVLWLAVVARDRRRLRAAVRRFTPWAAGAVAVLLATGPVMAWGRPGHSGLGLAVAKAGLLAACVVFAVRWRRRRPAVLVRVEAGLLALAAALGVVLAGLPVPQPPAVSVALVPGADGAAGCAARLRGASAAAAEHGRALAVSVLPGEARCRVVVAGRDEPDAEVVGAALGRVLAARGVKAVQVAGDDGDGRVAALGAGLLGAGVAIGTDGPEVVPPWRLESVAARWDPTRAAPLVVAPAGLAYRGGDPAEAGGYLDALGAASALRVYTPARLDVVPNHGGSAHARTVRLAPISSVIDLGLGVPSGLWKSTGRRHSGRWCSSRCWATAPPPS
jgi:hypothetical protein